MATRELSGPPNMLGLYARTLAPLVPGASRLPFVGGRVVPVATGLRAQIVVVTATVLATPASCPTWS